MPGREHVPQQAAFPLRLFFNEPIPVANRLQQQEYLAPSGNHVNTDWIPMLSKVIPMESDDYNMSDPIQVAIPPTFDIVDVRYRRRVARY